MQLFNNQQIRCCGGAGESRGRKCLKTTEIYRDMEKGKTNNPKGRPKGKPNKITADVRQWLAELIDGNRAQVKKDLKKLSPKDRLQIIEKFMQYVVPKQQATTLEIDYSKMTEEQLNNIINTLSNSIIDNGD